MRMLQKVAAETGHKLVLPEMVEMEYFAHYQHEVEAAVKSYQKASAGLRRLFPRWSAPVVPDSLCDSAEQDRRDHIKAIFGTYQMPEGVAREALIREVHRRPPAKTSWDSPGSGARDAVIWLTLSCTASRNSGPADGPGWSGEPPPRLCPVDPPGSPSTTVTSNHGRRNHHDRPRLPRRLLRRNDQHDLCRVDSWVVDKDW